MSCKFRVCETCILQILGVFVNDDVTGTSLQQQAERSLSSRSPSRSPSVSNGLSKESVPNSGRIESPVPRLNLSPNALRKCIAQAQHKGNAETLSIDATNSFQEKLQGVQAMHHSTQEVEMESPFSSAIDLRFRRERLLESLLQNEDDSKCAQNEFLDTINF